MSAPFRSGLLLLSTALALLAAPATAQQFKTFDEALREGTRLLRDRQFAASQSPLEAALRLAPDDAARLKVYQALLPAYRQLPEVDKMLEAQEFILRHSEQRAGRSLASRDVASFVHQRGKTEQATSRYEAKLKEDPQDVAALAILSVIYSRVQRNPRGEDLAGRLAEVERKLAQQAAQRHEKDSEAAPRLQAWYLKEAAVAWLEAGENAKALAAAKRSAASPPEERSGVLAFYWREALGDVFLKAGEPQLAVAQFEAAQETAPSDLHRQGVAKKIAEAKAAPAKP